MGALPDELWMRILESGVRTGQLQHRDLCALAIVSSRLKYISGSDFMWKQLVALEFPEPAGTGTSVAPSARKPGPDGAEVSSKRIYKARFEKVKEKKVAAHRRHVMRVASSLNMLQRESQYLQERLQDEREKSLSAQKELESLERASQTSVALQIWQPHAVSTWHEQVLQQMPIDSAARKNNLRLEVQVCRSRIHSLGNTLRSHIITMEQRQQELDALKYTPTRDLPGEKDVLSLVKQVGKKKKSTLYPNSPLASLGSLVTRK